MTVKELRLKLEQFPDDMVILVDDYADIDVYEQKGRLLIDAVGELT